MRRIYITILLRDEYETIRNPPDLTRSEIEAYIPTFDSNLLFSWILGCERPGISIPEGERSGIIYSRVSVYERSER